MDAWFDIDKFNIIEDDESYYFFRALNMADNQDLETGTILSEAGNIERIRTDRERYEENPENQPPKYSKDSQISLEEVYDHIKMHYRKDTNCISLSTNANVSISYGRGFYKDKYVMVKIPKKELGEKVINAGRYMLEEIKKKIDEYVSSMNLDDKIIETLAEIDNAKTSNEIKKSIEIRYSSKEKLDPSKSRVRKGISYKSPCSRISSYQSLNEEQSMAKNKIIAKLTLLERVGNMPPVIPHTANNNLLVQTIGNAFSSLEVIHYGDIQKGNIMDVPKEIVDIFALLQQVEGKEEQIVNDLKKDVIQFINEGKNIEILENNSFYEEDGEKEDITIEEMYELTEGKVEYGQANSIVKNMFYLAKSQLNARGLAIILRSITKDNPKYERVIEYIENNAFRIEPGILTRQSNKGYRLSESVNLNLKPNEIRLVQQIKGLTDEEQIEILKNGGLSNVRDIMTSNFSHVQTQEKIAIDNYYAEAIFSLYEWKKIGIEEFTIAERNNLLQKIQEEHCVDLYKKLEEKGIARNEIPTILLNIITRKKDFEITEEDTQENIKEKRLEQYDRIINENISDLKQDLSIERIERFLGYYDVKGTEIQLRSYQQRAVERANEILEEKRFASVILPTGAGKSFVALSQLIEHKDKEMLYLAPQNEILEQMKDYIIKYIHGPINTIGRTKDEIITDVFPNLKFSTYPALLTKNGKELINKEYDFVVLDELHRTGAKEWGSKLNALIDKQSDSSKVLGITATPRRDSDGINMAKEMAERLGYTNKEATRGEHIAMNMSLVNAMRMGIVVNPKLVSCVYSLGTDGSLDNLEEQIKQIEDVKVRNEKIEKYETLKRNLEKSDGIPEILQANIKKGGKYIVFLPVVDKLEDEDGNVIGIKQGKDKVSDYEKQIKEYFKGSDIKPNFHSMLGEYGDKDNERRLKEFQNRNTNDTEFMLVMNKANEGLHLDKLDGIIWLRSLDENSKILYLQQLGRVIYSEDPDSPTKDEDRPTVIDLVNNTLKVNWNNEITQQDDMEMLTVIVDWAEKHNSTLPDINSTNKEENGYATVLKEIQNKYQKYLDNDFKNLNEKQVEEVQEILRLGSLIDLWQRELPEKVVKNKFENEKSLKSNKGVQFELTGILKDFVELENEVYGIEGKSSVERFIEKIEKLVELGVDVSKIVLDDTIETLAKKSGIEVEQLQENGLEINYNIGAAKGRITQVYRGNIRGNLTEKQVERLGELDIRLEQRDRIQVFIETLEKLVELGVDVSKIVDKDTIETLAKKSEIDVKLLKEHGLEINYKIGNTKNNITQAYRNPKRGVPPTKEQVEELLKFGISLEKLEERDRTQEFIEILEKLVELGVDVSKIVSKDTIETLAKKSEIDVKLLKEHGLEINYKIGRIKDSIGQVYRGNERGREPTDEQVEKLQKLGINLEKLEQRDRVQVFIETLEKLVELGVDVSKILQKDTIETLAKKSEIDVKLLKEHGLEINCKIGNIKYSIIQVYRGQAKGVSPTNEQVEKLQKLGINLEKLEERDRTQEFIEVLKKLKELGVDVSKIVVKDTIGTLAKKSGIEVEQLQENGLDINYNIGYAKDRIAQAYRGKGEGKKPTKEQVERLLKLGISLEKRKRTGKEIAEASIISITDIEMADNEDAVLNNLVEKTKEGGIKLDEQS